MPNIARPFILTTEDRDNAIAGAMPRRGGDSLPRGNARLQYGAPAVVAPAPALGIVPVEDPDEDVPAEDDTPAEDDDPDEDTPEPAPEPAEQEPALVEQLRLQLEKRGKAHAQENL